MIITLLKKTAVRFVADDRAFFVSNLGLVLDGTPALGAPRAKVTNTSLASVHELCLPACF